MGNPDPVNPVQDWTDFLKQKCKKQLGEISRLYPGKRSVVVDYRDVERFGKAGLAMADDILDNPGKVLEDAWDAISANQLIKTHDGKVPRVHVRFVNLPRKIRIKDIRAEDVNRFATIEGMIVRASEVRPRMIESAFRCPAGHFTMRQQKVGKFTEPEKCGTDGCKYRKLDLMPKRSKFVDSQTGRIQETLEGQRAGEQPQNLPIDIEDDLCGQIIPGERVVLNGILRSTQRVVRGEKSSVFDIFLQVNSIERDQRNYGEITITPEEETEIVRISKLPDVLTQISKSILPAISGFEEEKKGISLFMFSPHQELSNGKRLRGSIHLMLGGDPGVSKSTLLLMLHGITPRSIYISGKSTSAAGLTFTMRQDEHDKRWVADAGAAVMADDSNLYVDELAQMEKPDIMALNEFMETQIIAIAKAGINAILQARCSVMVAMNPRYGRFDMAGAPLADQLDPKIPAQLLSRFDLIYLIPDVPEEMRDRAEAEAILGLWQGKSMIKEDQVVVPLPLVQKYIALARGRKNPKLTDAAMRLIADKYTTIRKSSNGGSITVTKRALESLARLATAHAIMRLADEVTVRDAEVAIKVFEYSLKQYAVDPNTHQYDADRAGGKTKDRRALMDDIISTIKEQGGKCGQDVICRELMTKNPGLIENKIRSAIEGMYREGILMEAGLGKYRVV